MTTTSPTYDVAMTDVNNTPVPEKNEGLYAECSMTTLDNTYAALNKTELQQETEQVYMNAAIAARKTASKAPKKQKFDVTSCKALACIFTPIAVMAAIMIICIASFSVEIAKLKSQTASVQQSPFDQQKSFLLQQQLQQNITDAIEAVRAESNQHLNTSIDALLSSLNKLMNQLDMSIHQFQQQAFDNHTLQLIEVNSAIVTIYQQLSQNISALKLTADQLLNLHLGLHAELPASSCAALLPTTPSGYYWVSSSNGSAVRVYCDMTRSCGGVTGGWVRVGYLDMTNSSHQCPSGFTEHNDSNVRTCRRTNTSAGCVSVMMDAPYQYSSVCGGVKAYQVGTTNAFRGRISASIDSAYVDGVSLTHGLLPTRQHIWTFAAGLNEGRGYLPSICRCNHNAAQPPPAFIGNDYFCESGIELYMPPTSMPPSTNTTINYFADPLWDGDGCGSTSTCCTFNDPPWFHKQLSDLTTDDIEMRVCTDEGADNENVYIEMVEIYVQ